jgi:hypothetical protein
MQDLKDTSTKSKEFRVRTGEEAASKIKTLMDAHYKQNPPKENISDTSKGSFMIKRSDGRFYMAGSEVLGSAEIKAKLGETGHQRRAKKKNLPIPDPGIARAGGRVARRILDPKTVNSNSFPVSISTDEYDGISGMFEKANVDQLQSVLKPHM